MKRLLFILLLVSSPAWAAVSHIAANQGFCNGTAGNGNMSGGGACGAPDVSTTFTHTATTTGNGVLLLVGCAATAATPSAVSLTASGWTITAVTGGIVGSTTNGFAAAFRAYAPNTSAATFTVTWTVSSGGCGNFMNSLIDEWSGMDATNFVDAPNSATGAAGCALTVTPTVNDAGLWFACNDSVTAVTGTFTKGGDDTQNDWSEWKILSGGSGAGQAAGFTSSGNMTIFGAAIKPAAGGATCNNRIALLGAGCS